MATVVNNPAPQENTGSGMGMLFGAIIFLVVLVLFFVYGLPALRNAGSGGGGTQISVPEQIDVNVSAPAQE